MKRILTIGLFTCVFGLATRAQAPEGFQIGAGIRLALPIGDFSDSHSFGIGGELQGEYGFSEMISGVVSAGYTSFIGKEIDFGFGEERVDAVGLIPILAGIHVYPSENFFIGGQVGYGILTGGGDSEGAFNYQPRIGYNAERFQVALNYNGLTKDGETLSHIALTAIFKLGGSGQ